MSLKEQLEERDNERHEQEALKSAKETAKKKNKPKIQKIIIQALKKVIISMLVTLIKILLPIILVTVLISAITVTIIADPEDEEQDELLETDQNININGEAKLTTEQTREYINKEMQDKGFSFTGDVINAINIIINDEDILNVLTETFKKLVIITANLDYTPHDIIELIRNEIQNSNLPQDKKDIIINNNDVLTFLQETYTDQVLPNVKRASLSTNGSFNVTDAGGIWKNMVSQEEMIRNIRLGVENSQLRNEAKAKLLSYNTLVALQQAYMQYNIDPFFIIAVAQKETNCGTNGSIGQAPNNNWFNIKWSGKTDYVELIDKKWCKFSTEAEAIHYFSELMSGSRYFGSGNCDVASICYADYCTTNQEGWISSVNSWMEQLYNAIGVSITPN